MLTSLDGYSVNNCSFACVARLPVRVRVTVASPALYIAATTFNPVRQTALLTTHSASTTVASTTAGRCNDASIYRIFRYIAMLFGGFRMARFSDRA